MPTPWRRYDLLVSVLFAGRGRRVRTTIADTIGLTPGQKVLDVGCGTGTLALSLAGRVGPGGSATGVDASPEMINAAQAKASRKGTEVRFAVAAAQTLPFADETFDAVTTSLTIHHVPEVDRPLAVRELLRVLRPGGNCSSRNSRPRADRSAAPSPGTCSVTPWPATTSPRSSTWPTTPGRST